MTIVNTKVLRRVSVIMLTLMLCAACATIDGIGQDVETAGEEIQEAAER